MNHTKESRKRIYADIAPASTWQEVDVRLREGIYADSSQWKRFLHLLLPALGISFVVSGVIFFFAYNWAELDKFIKLGLIEGMIVIAIALVLFTRWNLPVKQLILTGASFLVGALFAVYGQIYQTGANAYDFFLGWTAFVTLWAVASGYLPLWLLWIGLVNATIYLYRDQMTEPNEWQGFLLESAHTVICAIAAAVTEWLYCRGRLRSRSAWFINTLALAAIVSATINGIIGIMGDYYFYLSPSLLIVLIVFGSGLFYGLRKHQLFYMATIPFCIMTLLGTLILRTLDERLDIGVILLLGLMFIGGTTGLIFYLIGLKKKWYGTVE